MDAIGAGGIAEARDAVRSHGAVEQMYAPAVGESGGVKDRVRFPFVERGRQNGIAREPVEPGGVTATALAMIRVGQRDGDELFMIGGEIQVNGAVEDRGAERAWRRRGLGSEFVQRGFGAPQQAVRF